MGHFIRFIAFLLLYAAYGLVSALLLPRLGRLSEERPYLMTEMLNILGIVMLFATIFILLGKFDPMVFMGLLGASQIGVVLFAISNSLSGCSARRGTSQVLWITAEVEHKYKKSLSWLQFILGLTGIAYPIAVGFYFFSLSGQQADLRVLQCTLSFFDVGMLFVYPTRAAILLSKNINQHTRTQVLVAELSGFAATAIWLSLTFEAFGFPASHVRMDGWTVDFSPLLLGIAITAIFFPMSACYAIGTQRSKWWQSGLLTKRLNLLTTLGEILDQPDPSSCSVELVNFQKVLSQEITEFFDSENVFALSRDVEKGEISSDAVIARAYREARELDPRFEHLDALHLLSERVGEIEKRLESTKGEKHLKEVAKDGAEYIHPRIETLKQSIDEVNHTKMPVILSILNIILTVGNAVAGKFGDLLWTKFSSFIGLGTSIGN